MKDQTADPVLASYNNISISNWNNTQTWKASADWGKTITDAWKAEARMAVLDECTNASVKGVDANNQTTLFVSETGELNIESDHASQVAITDVLGRVVYVGEVMQGANIVNVSEWADGIYFVNIESKVNKFIKK